MHPRKGPRAVAATLAAALALPAAASAHVTLQPTTAPPGAFTRLDVRVPNERDDAGTVKVDVRLPSPSPFVSYEPRPGWKVTLKRSKLATPVEVEGFKVSEGVSQITWTGDGRQGIIRPGQFVDFGISLRMPDGKPGDELTFKALQTYQGGEVVRWIGPEDSDEPAPVVTLAGSAPAAAAAAAPSKDDGSDTLAIVALAAGLIGLAAGIAGLLAARRARAALAVALAAAAIGAPSASAHVGVKSISPKPGSKVARTLERVKVTFKGKIVDGHLTVTGPGGGKVSIGDGSVAGRKRVLRVRLKDHLARGRYRASMQVLNTDGHVTSRSWSFRLR